MASAVTDQASDKDTDTRRENPTEKRLRQIREDFAYVRSYWRENYEEAAKDMDCIAAKPPKEFSDDRSGRPCIWPDETMQYVNQANNNLRQNKRAIKISPKGLEATDEDAEHRQAYMRGIEDASKAQSIYTTGYESAVQCGFGFWRVNIIPVGGGKLEPRIKRIPNWATVYHDPDAKEADFSDACLCFVIDTMRESTFSRRYPKAQKRSFTSEDREVAPDWFHGSNIVVAEYWTRTEKDVGDGEMVSTVTQVITNGVEILDETDWIGSRIPIIGVFGKEIYLKDGGQSKRMFVSMVRNGRPAQQMMAYMASQEAEEIGMAPRAPYLGFKGQFPNADKTWKLAHKVPFAYLETAIPTDWPQGAGAPPLPQRNPFTPNIQAYEMAYERWRRSHQAAVAGTPLPTDAQKVNDKSGIALERIENAGMLGTFHFTDNFVRALRNTGEQTNELITKLAESESLPEQILGKDKKGEDVRLHVVPKGQQPPLVPPEDSEALPEANYFFAHRGQFTVGVSDGGSYQSEREEGSAFADKLLETIPTLGLPPQIAQQVMSIAIKLKNLGALGDELAEVFNPKDQTAQQMQQQQMQLAELQKQAAALAQEVQQLKLEKAGKVIDNEYKLQFTQLQNDIKVLIAEIQAKAQDSAERVQMYKEFWIENHGAAHEIAMQKDQQAHDAQQTMATAALQPQDPAATGVSSPQPSPAGPAPQPQS
jgi:hypothetical protein